jgi:hypothetical protein
MKSRPSPTRSYIQVLLRPPVDVDPGRRSHRYRRRVDHRNQCDRLYGVAAKFVRHSKRTDFGGSSLPEFPITFELVGGRPDTSCRQTGWRRVERMDTIARYGHQAQDRLPFGSKGERP